MRSKKLNGNGLMLSGSSGRSFQIRLKKLAMPRESHCPNLNQLVNSVLNVVMT